MPRARGWPGGMHIRLPLLPAPRPSHANGMPFYPGESSGSWAELAKLALRYSLSESLTHFTAFTLRAQGGPAAGRRRPPAPRAARAPAAGPGQRGATQAPRPAAQGQGRPGGHWQAATRRPGPPRRTPPPRRQGHWQAAGPRRPGGAPPIGRIGPHRRIRRTSAAMIGAIGPSPIGYTIGRIGAHQISVIIECQFQGGGQKFQKFRSAAAPAVLNI